jgi:hypothetical protein
VLFRLTFSVYRITGALLRHLTRQRWAVTQFPLTAAASAVGVSQPPTISAKHQQVLRCQNDRNTVRDNE